MKVQIIDFETDEEVGTLNEDGELTTEDPLLQEVADELPGPEGGITMLSPETADDAEGYADFVIEPGDEGFIRAVADVLPSPYDLPADELRELPHYSPPTDEEEAAEKAAESAIERVERSGGARTDQVVKLAEQAAEIGLNAATSDWTEKDWVEDPSPQAETTRWRNTETGEYRYQETKPGEGEGAEDDPTGDAGAPEEEEPEETEEGELDELVEIDDGVYANVQDFDPLYGDEPDPGDTVFLSGDPVTEQVEASGGAMMGPDGDYYVQVEYAGESMTIHESNVSGYASREEAFDVGDYEVETEWGLKFADVLNGSEKFPEAFNVREIQHHASDVDNPEILADAGAAERQGRDSPSAMKAIEGRLRALGEDPEEIIPGGGDGFAGFESDEYESWREAYDRESVTDSTTLRNLSGVEPGISADNMAVEELEGEDRRAFVTQYTDGVLEDTPGQGMDPEHRDEIVTLGHFAREASVSGNVVPVAHDEENGEWTAVKEFGDGVEAEEVSNTPQEWRERIDGGEAMDKFATMILGGARDLHRNNVMVSEDGDLGFHDLDHAGGDLMHLDGDIESYSGIAGKASSTLANLFQDHSYGELPEAFREHVEEDRWEQAHGFDRRHDFMDEYRKAITDAAQEKAQRLVEESDNPGEEYFYDPDEGYDNKQSQQNMNIRKNLMVAYAHATGEVVDIADNAVARASAKEAKRQYEEST